jgi:hypothetical protein
VTESEFTPPPPEPVTPAAWQEPDPRPPSPTPEEPPAAENALAPLVEAGLEGISAPAFATETPDPELLQFHGRRRAETTELVVGFDFGTSCSKVAVQSPYKQGGRVSFTDFGDIAHPSCRWLLPAVLYADSGGRLSLRPPTRAKGEARHLKVELLEESDGTGLARRRREQAMAAAAAYMGLALREVRRTFLEAHRDVYGASELRWALNLGIPSAGYDDEDVRRHFELIARAAWLLSLRGSAPTWEDALEAIGHSSLFSYTEVAVVPEVAAEVVTYAKSRGRRDDLHLVVDIGASTLDLCAFQLYQERGDDAYSLLTTRVERLGLLELHRLRMKAAERRPPFADVPADIVAELPSWSESEFGRETVERLQECDDQFVRECAKTLMEVLREVRERRHPNSPRWKEGIPLFLCGGGANASVTGRIVSSTEDKAQRAWSGFGGLQRHRLPLPAGVSDDEELEDVFGRLAVAYGLSFPAINIGRIEPPSEVEDLVAQPPDPPRSPMRNWRDRYIDKDQV